MPRYELVFPHQLSLTDLRARMDRVTAKLDSEPMAILTRTNGEAIRVWQAIMGTDNEGPPVRVLLHGADSAGRVPAWVGATLGPVQGDTISRQRFARVYQHIYAGDGAARAAALAIPDEDTAWRRLLRAAQLPDSAATLDLGVPRSRLGWPDLFPDDQGEQECPLSIMTVHQSKGREFANVSLLGSCVSDRVPDSEEEVLEEASVLFVGFTRAGQTLRRLPTGDLPAISIWTFAGGDRRRWRSRSNPGPNKVWFNLEMGLAGDLSPTSFIDVRLHQSDQAVEPTQRLLAEQAATLIGRVYTPRVIRRVARRKVQGAMQRTKDWIKSHRHLPGREFVRGLNRRINGRYNYYGLRGNSHGLWSFYKTAVESTFKWPNRRGGKRQSFAWSWFNLALGTCGVAKPRIVLQRIVLRELGFA